jgi:SAM-dependent methyltransferase
MATACRFCGALLTRSFADLGTTPLANSYLAPTADAVAAERAFPLHVMVCDRCLLVQVEQAVPAEAVFAADYAYLSSYSESWLAHCREYADVMITRLDLGSSSLVVEIASNDGYLLRFFRDRGIPVLGIEPAAHAAELARAQGIPTEVMFFNGATAPALAAQGVAADLMPANNVFAHVPDIGGFVAGFPKVLKPLGVISFEFPHLLNLIRGVQFDTIYHEHYSYLSLLVAERVLASAGLRAFGIEELPTHGGSLRLFACHNDAPFPEGPILAKVRADEATAGLDRPESYDGFAAKVAQVKAGFRAFLADAKASGKTVAAYGAAAKGNTFLNVCGATAADIAFVVDRNPQKQGKLLPGSHVPVRPPEALYEAKPDYVLILPWNLTAEIRTRHGAIDAWGGRFVTAVPEIRVY